MKRAVLSALPALVVSFTIGCGGDDDSFSLEPWTDAWGEEDDDNRLELLESAFLDPDKAEFHSEHGMFVGAEAISDHIGEQLEEKGETKLVTVSPNRGDFGIFRVLWNMENKDGDVRKRGMDFNRWDEEGTGISVIIRAEREAPAMAAGDPATIANPLAAPFGEYTAAWAATDEETRMNILDRIWDPDGEFLDPVAQNTGRDELSENIAGFQQQFPESKIIPTSRVELIGPRAARFNWDIVDELGRDSINGTDFATLSESGQITLIAGFWGELWEVED